MTEYAAHHSARAAMPIPKYHILFTRDGVEGDCGADKRTEQREGTSVFLLVRPHSILTFCYPP